MAYPGYQPPNRTNVGPPSKSKDQIARELDVARGRREFFSDRPDVSDDRALRRMKQFDEMRSFKNKLMDSGRVLKGVRSTPCRYISCDEVDAFPSDASGEGDPVALAEKRATTFSTRKKVLLTSTPTIKDFSRIESEYLTSDQRLYFVP